MFKILYCYELINEIQESEKLIDECLEKDLIRFLHEKYNPAFIVLESNINSVKEILGNSYNKSNETSLIELIKDDFKIDIVDIDLYFPKDKILEIYNSKCPYDTIKEILNENLTI